MALLVGSQGTGLMTVETHCNVAEHRCSMTAQGLMHTLPAKPFNVYIIAITAKWVTYQKFVKVVNASSAPACLVHASSEEPYMSKNEGQISTQRDRGNTHPTIKIARYKPQERCKEQVDPHNFVKQLDQKSNTDWGKGLVIPDH